MKEVEGGRGNKSWGKVCGTETTPMSHLQQECCDNQLLSSSPFLFSSPSLCKFHSCSVKQVSPFAFFWQKEKPVLLKQKQKQKKNETKPSAWGSEKSRRRHVSKTIRFIFFLPYLVALVLVADGQQIQQDFIEVAQSEVYTHHCDGITGGHLRATARGGERGRKGEGG